MGQLRQGACAFFGFMLVLSIAVGFPRGHYVLVVVDPRADALVTIDTIGRAGGSLVSFGRTPWIAVAYSEHDGFTRRLFAAGALVVLNHALAVGCRQKDNR